MGMPAELRDAAEAAKGFMPPAEGLALYAAAAAYAGSGPILEVGTYCGKSTIYRPRRRARRPAVITVDHHHGSEENQPGWEYHDPGLVDPRTGLMDTLPFFRATWARPASRRRDVVVGRSAQVARLWWTPLGCSSSTGGTPRTAAQAD